MSFTPGWNDPPPLSLGAGPNGGDVRSTRAFLSRRVAPGKSSTGQLPPDPQTSNVSQEPVNSVMAPPPTFPVCPVPTLPPEGSHYLGVSAASSDPSDPFQAKQISGNQENPISANDPDPATVVEWSDAQIIESMENCLTTLNLSGPQKTNIEKKLENLKKCLTENGKLSSACRSKLVNLAMSVSNKDWDKAYNIHSLMMADHYAEVSSWMVGVKAMILEAKKNVNPVHP